MSSIPLVNALRQADLPTVPASFSAWVEIEGTEYAIVKLAVRYSRTETKMVVDLASGNASRDIGGRPALPSSFEFVKGTPARVILEVDKEVRALWASGPDRGASQDILLKAGQHVLMDGVIDDGGPSDLSSGRFNMRCVIVSKLLYLASGATHFSNVSTAHLNTSLITGLVATDSLGRVSSDVASIDFWDSVRTAMIAILGQRFGFADANRIQRFLQFSGSEFGDLPLPAIRALNSIRGSLRSGNFGNSGMATTVANYLNRELYRDLGQQSILARVQALADDFFFALIEHSDSSGIVPYTPFVHSDDCKNLWPSTVESVSWMSHDTVVMSGLVFMESPYGTMNQPQGTIKGSQRNEQFIMGGYKRRATRTASNEFDQEGNNLGLITTLPAPTWMQGIGDGTPDLQAQDVRSSFGNFYAREIALKQTYMGRMVSVRSPLRMDVGPCTPVHIVYPAIAGEGVSDDTSMYGSVEAVTLVIDASAAKAMTEMEVMYVRSKAQQNLDIDERPVPSDGLTGFGGEGSGFASARGFHPLWAEPFLGRRLDERPTEELTESNLPDNVSLALFGEAGDQGTAT